MMRFQVRAHDGAARTGLLQLPHGEVATPAFMPVGTYGAVKSLAPSDLREVGAQIVLGNTYHLWLRPGLQVIGAHGGLHRFIGWDGPILTDSGGFQVFSLGALRQISEDGARFRSPINGDPMLLTPEESIRIQHVLDSDIAMVFDECTPYWIESDGPARPATEREASDSMQLSLRWARRCRDELDRLQTSRALFGIVQGGMLGAARAVGRRAARDRIRRLRDRGPLGRRAQGADAGDHAAHGPAPAAAGTALPDGCGNAGGPAGGDGGGH
jgi:queuine tRNA-ribosyltransferase